MTNGMSVLEHPDAATLEKLHHGELSYKETARLNLHKRECGECRGAYDDIALAAEVSLEASPEQIKFCEELIGRHRRLAAEELRFSSTAHGAGRVMSRHAAIRATQGRALARELEDKGIQVRSRGKRTLGEEAPEAYKDIHQVVNVVDSTGIASKVARMRPLGVIKG